MWLGVVCTTTLSHVVCSVREGRRERRSLPHAGEGEAWGGVQGDAARRRQRKAVSGRAASVDEFRGVGCRGQGERRMNCRAHKAAAGGAGKRQRAARSRRIRSTGGAGAAEEIAGKRRTSRERVLAVNVTPERKPAGEQAWSGEPLHLSLDKYSTVHSVRPRAGKPGLICLWKLVEQVKCIRTSSGLRPVEGANRCGGEELRRADDNVAGLSNAPRRPEIWSGAPATIAACKCPRIADGASTLFV